MKKDSYASKDGFDSEDRRKIEILWTGGWDSTYRIVELSRQNVTIKPVYVIDSCRSSMNYELTAMKKITKALIDKSETKAEFMPLETIKVEDIPKDKEITNAYERIIESVKLGSQYDWLARLAKTLYPGIEIGIEKPNGEYSGCKEAIEKFGKLIYDTDAYIIDRNSSSMECIQLFGNLRFPIIETTETEMQSNIFDWGQEEIMKSIWFCHSPIKGEICGYCRPCQQKMECEMQWLLPQDAQRRYYTFKKISVFSGKLAYKIMNFKYRK